MFSNIYKRFFLPFLFEEHKAKTEVRKKIALNVSMNSDKDNKSFLIILKQNINYPTITKQRFISAFQGNQAPRGQSGC